MSPRTWLSSGHGLRVSKPGVSVLSATEAQLAFDSDKALPWLYYRATLSVAGRASPGDPPGQQVVTYPDTLTALPIAFVSHPYDAYNMIQMGTGAFTLTSGPPAGYLAHYQVIVATTYFALLNLTGSPADFAVSLYRTA